MDTAVDKNEGKDQGTSEEKIEQINNEGTSEGRMERLERICKRMEDILSSIAKAVDTAETIDHLLLERAHELSMATCRVTKDVHHLTESMRHITES